ncbi:MAG: FAD-binding oxidoreductase [Spirochaetia bacterium]
MTHRESVEAIRSRTRSFYDAGQKVKVYHGHTNSTRAPEFEADRFVDISMLSNVLEVNASERCALVEPNVPMDRLVEHTLPFGLLPPVVMEFPGITVGGGVQGTGLESSSFKHGSFHDSCLEYEVVLGNGEIVVASPQRHPDLFYGMPGSYGSLGILTLVKLQLIPASPFVHLRYHYAGSFEEAISLTTPEPTEHVDFIDGIACSGSQAVVMTGRFSDGPSTGAGVRHLPVTRFTRAYDEWFAIHARNITQKFSEKRIGNGTPIREELLPVRDYLFRYNRGAFWMGHNAFTYFKRNIPFNRLTRTMLNFITNTRRLYRLLHETNVSHQYMIQDVDVPREHALELLHYVDRTLGIYPLWLCPWRPDRSHELSPNHLHTDMVMNVGIWGKLAVDRERIETLNRDLERKTAELSGRKMLYAHTYYEPEEFWSIYDQRWYTKLRAKYYADKVFPDVYEKVRTTPRRPPDYYRGIWRGLRSLRIPIRR